MLIFNIKRSVATKRSKKPAAATSVSSQPAVTAGPSVGSPVSLPSFIDDDRLKEAVLSALQTLSKKGSLGTNPFSFTAPFPVPDSDCPQRESRGGDGCPEHHNVVGTTRSPAVGACEVDVKDYLTPYVKSHVYPSMSISRRSDQVISSGLESMDSASIGIHPFPLLSSGLDQLRVPQGGNLGASVSSLSPTSLMFPLPDSGFSSLPGPSSSFPPVSVSGPSSSGFSSSSLPSSSFSTPSFHPSSLSSASFPSSASVTSASTPSIPSVLSSSSSAPPPPSSSSHPFSSSSSSFQLPPPPGFPPMSSSSSFPSSLLHPPPPHLLLYCLLLSLRLRFLWYLPASPPPPPLLLLGAFAILVFLPSAPDSLRFLSDSLPLALVLVLSLPLVSFLRPW